MLDELEQHMLRDVNARHADARRRSESGRTHAHLRRRPRHDARSAEALDLSRETEATHRIVWRRRAATRIRSPGSACSPADLIERGVRVVELIDTGSHDNWDAHGDMQQHRGKAVRVDRAAGRAIKDLKRRGLLESTLIVDCTEFGRTPWAAKPNEKGAITHARRSAAFWPGPASAAVWPMERPTRTGPRSSDPCHVHDYHATILHLMGIDHTRLTYRYAGRDFRLTDVAGNVLHPILA